MIGHREYYRMYGAVIAMVALIGHLALSLAWLTEMESSVNGGLHVLYSWLQP